MTEETKEYLRKRLNFSIVWSISGVILCAIILFLMLRGNRQKSMDYDSDTAVEMRKLNNNVIAAKQAQEEELKKAGEESVIRDKAHTMELESIHSDIKSYKIQNDEKNIRIGKYSSPDIISEFSKLQRQYVAPKQPVTDSTNDY